MRYKAHIGIGFLSIFFVTPIILLFTSLHLTDDQLLVIFFFILIGSVLPDIDLPGTRASRAVQILMLLNGLALLFMDLLVRDNESYIAIYAFLIGVPICSFLLTSFLYNVFGHRTITHSLLIVLLFTIGGIFLVLNSSMSFIELFFFLWAYTLHIILDARPIKGVAYLYPFSKEFYYIRIPIQYGRVASFGNKAIPLLIWGYIIFSVIYFFVNDGNFWSMGNTIVFSS